MIRPGTTAARALSAGVVGCSVVTLAITAHVVAHGTAPPLLALAPVVLLIAGATFALSDARVAGLRLFALLGIAQLVVHLLSSYLTGPGHHTSDVSTLLMTSAHLVSTIATAMVLAHGERIWWQLHAWLGVLQGILTRWTLAVPRDVTTITAARGFADLSVIRFAVGTRGPPAPAQI